MQIYATEMHKAALNRVTGFTGSGKMWRT
jgi:hypothetical protein